MPEEEEVSTPRMDWLRLGCCLLVLAAATTAATADDKPLKVFILAGQSNMRGHARISTFDSMADDPKTAALRKEMRTADGQPRMCDKVWISSVGCAGDGWSDVIEQQGNLTAGFGASTDKIGLEFTFGITLEKSLGKAFAEILVGVQRHAETACGEPPSN